jgi:hypothetical protein
VTVHRVLRTAKATLSKTFYLDEAGTDATGDVVVSFTRLDGTVVQFGNATGPDLQNAYSITFNGSDVLDELTVTWVATVGGDALILDQDSLEIVGGFYFGLAEGRAEDPALSSTAKFPTSELIEKRIEAEEDCERITGQAWVPRFRRATVSGAGNSVLVLPDTMIRTIRSVSTALIPVPAAFTSEQIAAVTVSESGAITTSRGWALGNRNITVEYEHGHDRPPPPIVRAAKLHFKSLLLEGRSSFPDRAERVVTQSDTGTVVYSSPTPDRVGIPAVDAIYGRYPTPRPGFG